MAKENKIYEGKADKRKSVIVVFRLTQAGDKELRKRVEKSGGNQSDYLEAACLGKDINVIPEGKDILQTLHEVRDLLRDIPKSDFVKEVERLSGQIVVMMRKMIKGN